MKRTISIVAVAAIMAAMAGAEPPARSHTAFAELKSGVIATVEYNLVEQSMLVHFHSGATYQYVEVPESVFSGLVNAEKPGHFFVKHIRNKFENRREFVIHGDGLARAADPQSNSRAKGEM